MRIEDGRNDRDGSPLSPSLCPLPTSPSDLPLQGVYSLTVECTSYSNVYYGNSFIRWKQVPYGTSPLCCLMSLVQVLFGGLWSGLDRKVGGLFPVVFRGIKCPQEPY